MALLIADRFDAAGFGIIQQAAAIANAIAESGLVPNKKSPAPENSYGLFQLNTKPHCRGDLADILRLFKLNYSISDLKDPEKNIAITLNWLQSDKQLAHFKTASSLRDAILIFMRKFENPRDKTQTAINKRIKNAPSLII
jgi:hypothetical protein